MEDLCNPAASLKIQSQQIHNLLKKLHSQSNQRWYFLEGTAQKKYAFPAQALTKAW